MLAPWRFWVARAEDPGPGIVHHDEHLLIVYKPAGLPTTAPTSSEPCLDRWVRVRFPDLRPHATSRLDSQVSGLVTFALTREANQHLLAARHAGTYERVYLGITVCDVPNDLGVWTWPISIDPRSAKRRVAGPGRGERAALTRYEIVARTGNGTLLRLRPETGRTHQLRVHAAAAGTPLFGDHVYRAARRRVLADGSVVAARRVMLHCARVSFPSPFSQGRMRLAAPIPADMTGVWLALGGTPNDLQS